MEFNSGREYFQSQRAFPGRFSLMVECCLDESGEAPAELTQYGQLLGGPRFQSDELLDSLRLPVHKDYGPAVKVFHVLEIGRLPIAGKLLLCLLEL